jgi:hypothetical protein
MADNPTIDNGTLPDFVVSADETASGYIQRMKIAYSANGVDTLVQADADGLLVNLGANNDVTVTGMSTLSGAIVTASAASTGTDPGLPTMFVRDDALSTIGPIESDWTPGRVDSNGALWVQIAGAISSLIDSIRTTPDIPPGSTAFDVHYNNTAAAGAGSAATVFDPPTGQCIVVTDLTISSYDTTAGKVILYFGADADTTYSIGTDQPLEVVNLAPSASVAPGATYHYTKPIKCLVADRQLKYQNTAAIDVDITVHGYTYTP